MPTATCGRAGTGGNDAPHKPGFGRFKGSDYAWSLLRRCLTNREKTVPQTPPFECGDPDSGGPPRDDLPPWLPPGFLMAAALESRAGNPHMES